SARSEEANPGGRADGERAADRRRAEAALGDAHRQVSRPGLARRLAGVGESPELVSRKPDPHGAVEHADRRGHHAGVAQPPTSVGDAGLAGRSPPRALAEPAAPRCRTPVAGGAAQARLASRSSAVAKTTPGSSASSARRSRSGPMAEITRVEERSTLAAHPP